MVLRYLILMSCLLSLLGCHRTTTVLTPVTQVNKSSQQTRSTPDFSRVYVNGVLNVSLHTGYAHPHVILRGDPRDLAYVVMNVVNGELRVTLGAGYPQHGGVQVEIDSHYLNFFEYRGAGTVIGDHLNPGLLGVVIDNPGKTRLKGRFGLRRLEILGGGDVEISGLNSPYLQIKHFGKAQVKLGGIVNLTSLDIRNDGRLSLYWVRSKQLIVRGHGKAFIQLAGIADILNVELWDAARFNGRYLRANRAFVRTHNKSVAEMSAVQHQHTLASETSDIHFYNIPTMKADFMANSGAVLDMRDLSLPFIQEYTEYNK